MAQLWWNEGPCQTWLFNILPRPHSRHGRTGNKDLAMRLVQEDWKQGSGHATGTGRLETRIWPCGWHRGLGTRVGCFVACAILESCILDFGLLQLKWKTTTIQISRKQVTGNLFWNAIVTLRRKGVRLRNFVLMDVASNSSL